MVEVQQSAASLQLDQLPNSTVANINAVPTGVDTTRSDILFHNILPPEDKGKQKNDPQNPITRGNVQVMLVSLMPNSDISGATARDLQQFLTTPQGQDVFEYEAAAYRILHNMQQRNPQGIATYLPVIDHIGREIFGQRWNALLKVRRQARVQPLEQGNEMQTSAENQELESSASGRFPSRFISILDNDVELLREEGGTVNKDTVPIRTERCSVGLYDVALGNSRGKERFNKPSQDSVAVAEIMINEKKALFVICADGMGGYAGGQEASLMVLTETINQLQTLVSEKVDAATIPDLLKTAIESANRILCEKNKEIKKTIPDFNSGSTFVGALVLVNNRK